MFIIPILFLWLALISLMAVGYLHGVVFHDDTGATAGTDLAAAAVIDGEDKVIMREIGGGMVSPTLIDIHYGVFGVFAAAGMTNAYWKLQPNPWPETKTLGGPADIGAGSRTADAGVTMSLNGRRLLTVRNKYNIPLTNNLDWLNPGNSVVYTPIATGDFVLMLYMSYGTVSKSRGGHLLHIRKAFAAVAAADVWDTAFNEVLTDDSPGLDPDRRYRLYAAAAMGAGTVATDWCEAVRLWPKGSTTQITFLGSGNTLGPVITVFEADSIEMNGNAIVQCETIGSATNDGGEIHLWWEDIGPAITGGSQGGSGGRIEPSGGGGFGGGMAPPLAGGGGPSPWADILGSLSGGFGS
jgi:hypothetical protein